MGTTDTMHEFYLELAARAGRHVLVRDRVGVRVRVRVRVELAARAGRHVHYTAIYCNTPYTKT